VQGALERVQLQLQQQRSVRALAQARNAPVDIQIGFHVFLQVPQEMRSRLWLVLLEDPTLAAPFQVCSGAPSGASAPAVHAARSVGAVVRAVLTRVGVVCRRTPVAPSCCVAFLLRDICLRRWWCKQSFAQRVKSTAQCLMGT
jgi:hypothetical protein